MFVRMTTSPINDWLTEYVEKGLSIFIGLSFHHAPLYSGAAHDVSVSLTPRLMDEGHRLRVYSCKVPPFLTCWFDRIDIFLSLAKVGIEIVFSPYTYDLNVYTIIVSLQFPLL
jgi:hypothetical protein